MSVGTFFKLIRWKNLIMICLIQILFKYVYFSIFSVDTTLDTFHFILLMLSTVLIAAGGNILNDVYDLEADKINKPSKVLASKEVSVSLATNLYYITTFAGILIGFYIAYHIHQLGYISIFIITALLLKVYNSGLKRLPIIGNVIVSLLVSLSILIVGIFDIIPKVTEENAVDQYYAFKVLTDYAIFAFIFMLLREMVKDIEDVNGDLKLNMKTLPILVGRKRSNYIVFIVSFVPLILVTHYSFANFMEVPVILAYMLIVVLLPFLHFMTKILYAKSKKDYTYTSKLLKIIMLLGILSILVISLNIYYAS